MNERSRGGWFRFLVLALLAAIWWPIVVLFVVAAGSGGCVGPCPPEADAIPWKVRILELFVVALPILGIVLIRRSWGTRLRDWRVPSARRRSSNQ
jgi:hypothetical protein